MLKCRYRVKWEYLLSLIKIWKKVGKAESVSYLHSALPLFELHSLYLTSQRAYTDIHGVLYKVIIVCCHLGIIINVLIKSSTYPIYIKSSTYPIYIKRSTYPIYMNIFYSGHVYDKCRQVAPLWPSYLTLTSVTLSCGQWVRVYMGKNGSRRGEGGGGPGGKTKSKTLNPSRHKLDTVPWHKTHFYQMSFTSGKRDKNPKHFYFLSLFYFKPPEITGFSTFSPGIFFFFKFL